MATIREFWSVIFAVFSPLFPKIEFYTRFVAKILVGPSLEKFLAAPMHAFVGCFVAVGAHLANNKP